MFCVMMIVKQKRSTVLSNVKMTLVVCQYAFRMELLAARVSFWPIADTGTALNKKIRLSLQH